MLKVGFSAERAGLQVDGLASKVKDWSLLGSRSLSLSLSLVIFAPACCLRESPESNNTLSSRTT